MYIHKMFRFYVCGRLQVKFENIYFLFTNLISTWVRCKEKKSLFWKDHT